MHIRLTKIAVFFLFVGVIGVLINLVTRNTFGIWFNAAVSGLSVLTILICMIIDLIQQELKCGDYRD